MAVVDLMTPHHVGYVVDDLEHGVERFAAATGAGPFLAIEHMRFDEVTYRGGPAAYDHSSAFGAYGELLVEITQVFSAEPPELEETLAGRRGLGHLGFLVDDPGAAAAQFAAAGSEVFHTGRTGPASATWLTGGELFGHSIELLRRAPELEGFYAQVRAAAADWDGTEPLRRIA
ncbi:MAG: VOC family protein [Verrucomicrobia bacterium]|nr:VOC family protein [Verrucomicrobiota bacterium]